MTNDPHSGRIGHAIVSKPDHAFDPDSGSVDPHGDHAGHHGHVIVSSFTLKAVLGVLIVLTLATVGQAQLEVFIQNHFDMVFPKWVNVVACMGIAVVKAALVCLYFMQLKYDNPLNSIVFLFTLLGVGLFLGFTALDIGTRDSIYEYKSRQIIEGGAGLGGAPATATARQALLERVGPEKFELIRADVEGHKHGHGGTATPNNASSAGQSRPAIGTTPGLFDEQAPAADGHDHGHDAQGEAKPGH